MATQATVINNLNQVKSMYDNYTSLKGYMAPYGGYAAAMAAKKGELEANLARMDDVIRTYEHEFQERSQNGTARPGFWARRGLITSGDWALAFFYLAYATMCLTVIVYIYKNSKTPTRGVVTAAFFFAIIGLMITATLLRFA